MTLRLKIEQVKSKQAAQSTVEVALLAPIVVGLTYVSFLFYQGFVEANLYGRNANVHNYYSKEGENQALGLEMAVSLPFP